jgi:polyphosphate kinase
MEQAGVHVVYGFPNLKIHAKTTLVVRREEGELRRYVHVGTGNYHALTARAYEDFGLFTADEEIAADVADLFNYVTGFSRLRPFRKLLVAPFDLRDRLIEQIRAVGAAAAEGKKATIRIKVNNLNDPALIEELYAASGQGAQIDVIARSICSLRPGVEGLSERIRVRSVLGRFLEHSRVFVFDRGDDARYFIGSADLMPRNLDHRIEIVTPVEDAKAQREIDRVFEVLLEATTHAWDLGADGRWKPAAGKKNARATDAQVVLMRGLQTRARRQSNLRRAG